MTILGELFDSVWGQCSSPAEGAIDFAMLTARLEAVPFQSRVTDLRWSVASSKSRFLPLVGTTILGESFASLRRRWSEAESLSGSSRDWFCGAWARLEAVPFQNRLVDLRLVGGIFQTQIPPVGRNDNFGMVRFADAEVVEGQNPSAAEAAIDFCAYARLKAAPFQSEAWVSFPQRLPLFLRLAWPV